MQLTVARIGRAHGLRGEVALELHTDDPDRRFSPGSQLATRPSQVGPLVVAAMRYHQGRLLVSFEGFGDRTKAELLRGVELIIEAEEGEEDDAWYPHELTGLRAEDTAGTVLGTVTGLENAPAHDLLMVRDTSGQTVLVPFVHQIVPVVDVQGGRVVLDPPGGLFPTDKSGGDSAGPDTGETEGPEGHHAD